MSTPEPERSRVVYVTPDSSQWLVLDIPFGLVAPPTISVHRPPLYGPVEFYHASAYNLPVPAGAERTDDA
jgi:hypothetical protein